jgi:hypothetical protein
MKRRCCALIAVIGLLSLVVSTAAAQGRGRVPTGYNQRYQALYAEQELFRKRPELLGCVQAAKDAIQTSDALIFNKLRFNTRSVESAYVVEGVVGGKSFQTVRMRGEGRVRAYSFLENWETADIRCHVVSGDDPSIRINVAE